MFPTYIDPRNFLLSPVAGLNSQLLYTPGTHEVKNTPIAQRGEGFYTVALSADDSDSTVPPLSAKWHRRHKKQALPRVYHTSTLRPQTGDRPL